MAEANELPVITVRDQVLSINGPLTVFTVHELERVLATVPPESFRVIDGTGVTTLDSSGAVCLNRIRDSREFKGFSKRGQKLLEMSRLPEVPPTGESRRSRLDLEAIGDWAMLFSHRFTEILILIVDIVYWSVIGLFDRRQYRKGSFVEQAYYMGSTALPIVAVIIFLIGFILALQSAAQLRQFGATIFVVDLVAIGLAREMAPLMVAILVSGRSGSAIASEVATMKFTEELDAIRTMGLNPLRFVIVPKLWAMLVSMPLLSILALLIGILGGFVVGVTYMDLTPTAFWNQLMRALFFWDVLTGVLKSLSYAVIITIVGTYRGLTFTGGADGVGRATTSAVVTSLFVIIVADSIWGIILYFR